MTAHKGETTGGAARLAVASGQGALAARGGCVQPDCGQAGGPVADTGAARYREPGFQVREGR